MKKTKIVDVVVVYSVMWAEGVREGVKGARVKGWTVATRQGTRMNEIFPP
jgi:hypothetical protein